MILAILDAGLTRHRPSEMLMAPVAGQPMIWRMVERVRAARTLTRVMVATSRDPADDALCGYLMSRGQAVFRGRFSARSSSRASMKSSSWCKRKSPRPVSKAR